MRRRSGSPMRPSSSRSSARSSRTMRRALSGDGIAARSSSRRGYHRTTSAPSNTNLSIANHNHHLHHHHNEMLQQHRKGQDPMDTFDHVRDWTLHQYTELQIVRPKDNRYDHEEYVLKCIRLGAKQTNTDNGDDIRQKDKTQVDPHQLRTIRNAIASIQVMDHPHILGIFDVYEYQKTVYIVMEHHADNGGPIWWKNSAHKRYREPTAAQIVWQILHIVKYMHDHQIVHGELRPEIMVFDTDQSDENVNDDDDDSDDDDDAKNQTTYNNNIKLIDFGFHRYQDNSSNNTNSMDDAYSTDDEHEFQDSKYCHSPEALVQEELSFASDIWSVGVMTYILLSGRLPFTSESELTSIWGNEICLDMSGTSKKRKVWKHISDDAKDFIRQCLTLDANERVSVDEALRHPWMMCVQEQQQANRGHYMSSDDNEDALEEQQQDNSNNGVNSMCDKELAEGLADHLVVYSKEPKLKRSALSMIAHKAHSNSPEIREFLRVFEHFDVDKDGTISRGELHTALRSLGSTNEQILDIYESMDLDGDTQIEYTEFLGAVLEFYHDVSEDDLRLVFDRICGEGNTCITIRRLMGFFDVPMAAAQRILNEIDDNQNGRVSFDEFYHVFRRGSKSREIREKRLAKLRAQKEKQEEEKRKKEQKELEKTKSKRKVDPEQERWRRMTKALGGSKRDKEAVRKFLDTLGGDDDDYGISSKNKQTNGGLDKPGTSIRDLRSNWKAHHEHYSTATIPSEIDTEGEDMTERSSGKIKKKAKKKRKATKRKSGSSKCGLENDSNERSSRSIKSSITMEDSTDDDGEDLTLTAMDDHTERSNSKASDKNNNKKKKKRASTKKKKNTAALKNTDRTVKDTRSGGGSSKKVVTDDDYETSDEDTDDEDIEQRSGGVRRSKRRMKKKSSSYSFGSSTTDEDGEDKSVDGSSRKVRVGKDTNNKTSKSKKSGTGGSRGNSSIRNSFYNQSTTSSIGFDDPVDMNNRRMSKEGTKKKTKKKTNKKSSSRRSSLGDTSTDEDFVVRTDRTDRTLKKKNSSRSTNDMSITSSRSGNGNEGVKKRGSSSKRSDIRSDVSVRSNKSSNNQSVRGKSLHRRSTKSVDGEPCGRDSDRPTQYGKMKQTGNDRLVMSERGYRSVKGLTLVKKKRSQSVDREESMLDRTQSDSDSGDNSHFRSAQKGTKGPKTMEAVTRADSKLSDSKASSSTASMTEDGSVSVNQGSSRRKGVMMTSKSSSTSGMTVEKKKKEKKGSGNKVTKSKSRRSNRKDNDGDDTSSSSDGYSSSETDTDDDNEKSARVDELLESAMEKFLSGKDVGSNNSSTINMNHSSTSNMNQSMSSLLGRSGKGKGGRGRAQIRAKTLMMETYKAQERDEVGPDPSRSPSPVPTGIVGRPGQSPGALKKGKRFLDSLVYSHQVGQLKEQMADLPPEIAAIEAWNDYDSRVTDGVSSGGGNGGGVDVGVGGATTGKPRAISPFAKLRRKTEEKAAKARQANGVGSLFSF